MGVAWGVTPLCFWRVFIGRRAIDGRDRVCLASAMAQGETEGDDGEEDETRTTGHKTRHGALGGRALGFVGERWWRWWQYVACARMSDGVAYLFWRCSP